MPQQGKKMESAKREQRGLERLGMRVSNMINHPIAQLQRWVTIHRLDSDSEDDWQEIMGLLSETDGIEITFNDEDESVTLRWEPQEREERPDLPEDSLETEVPAPF